ncbi:glycosyltransferase family 4 protein [Streptomyces sp. ID05-04B]|uniref:glycosyltransferase family 4 protein n=1 Tax=Streptomyces sp. ID05-04B TaxID=3028661 RepID=UPI0029C2A85C|nr:glycosyltransferase family 4 protein [Streptomyces sp. ID05-04B]MDX5568517.1 glycosyltransferase family 4 protein [Streptomyces sp. ID05-04B]
MGRKRQQSTAAKKARELQRASGLKYTAALREVTFAGSAAPRRILSVASEWHATHGGLSVLNRDLCTALAEAGAEVYCLVPSSSEVDRMQADAVGVHLVSAAVVEGMSEHPALMRKPTLPHDVTPDAVIGHGRVTGPAAKVLVEDHYPSAARLHFVHVAPDQIEWHKLDRTDDAAERAELRVLQELNLARDATRTFAVGPVLASWLDRDLSVYESTPPPLRLDPGFDIKSGVMRQPPPGVPQILMTGRMEDASLKGLDLAAKAVGQAIRLSPLVDQWELLVRGAPAGSSVAMRDQVLTWVDHHAVHVTTRNYSTSFDVEREVRRASLVVMPSRAEAFGLVGLEAIQAGTPVLVSSRSGLGVLLREVLAQEADRFVVPVGNGEEADVLQWGHAIAAVMRDRGAAFAAAEKLRYAMARERSWAAAARLVLDSVPS